MRRPQLFATASTLFLGASLVWVGYPNPPPASLWRLTASHAGGVLLAGTFGWIGYRFRSGLLGFPVAALLPVLLTPPWEWTLVTPILGIDACCLPLGISVLSGVAAVVGAGASRIGNGPEEAPSDRAVRLLLVGAFCLLAATILLAWGELPERYAMEGLEGAAVILVLASTATWGWALRAWWPAGYVAGACTLVLYGYAGGPQLLLFRWAGELGGLGIAWIVLGFFLPVVTYALGVLLGRRVPPSDRG